MSMNLPKAGLLMLLLATIWVAGMAQPAQMNAQPAPVPVSAVAAPVPPPVPPGVVVLPAGVTPPGQEQAKSKSEADIELPKLKQIYFTVFGQPLRGVNLMYIGLVVCVLGLLFGLIQYRRVSNSPTHKSMGAVSETIWETCKTYLLQQGKFLIVLWVLIGVCMVYYFGFLKHYLGMGKFGPLL